MATYAPHPCAVAAFTYDLATAAFPRQIVAIHPPDGPAAYPAEVQHRIRRDEAEDYARVAAALNASTVDVVSVHFEPTIWGGTAGGAVLDFLAALDLPAVTTFHAIPPRPTQAELGVIRGIVAESASVVVLSPEAATLLERACGVERARIEIVPHGVPNLPLLDADTVKPRLGLEGRHLVLSFGLLDPGKGLEAAVRAMRTVVDADPSALYVVLGATRLDRLGIEGEAYREQLEALAATLDLTASVRFENRFVGRVELARWVEAADVVLAPYSDPGRVTSGTIAYAMSAGRAVVAAPSVHARARLSKGRGVVLADATPDAIAEAVLRLLGDRRLRDACGRKAWDATRPEVWSEAGAAYSRIFARVARPRRLAIVRPRPLAPVAR